MPRLLILAAAILITSWSIAQEDPGAQPFDDACLLVTDATVWASLNLTTEQMDQVKAMQTQCKTDCAATQESGKADPAAGAALLKRYEERLRGVLTPDQYRKWVAWCGERPGRT